MTVKEDYILNVIDLEKHFPIKKGVLKRTVGLVHAINGVSFKIRKKESFGLVGESGCGKSTLGKCIVFLYEPTRGEIIFNGVNLGGLDNKKLRKIRPQFQMIFQDPYSTLNPRMSVEAMLSEPLKLYNKMSTNERRDRVFELLEIVGLRPEHSTRYPHEFSGGQRQRIAVARALALNPSLIICDEPVSALDVSIQAQILNLFDKLKKKFGLSYLFISHDIGVVEHVADRIAVMYLGKIVELAKDTEICQNPQHPYTKALMAAIPIPKSRSRDRVKISLTGDVPSPIDLPSGCFFHHRCPHAMSICKEKAPETVTLSDGREVSCHLFNEGDRV
ncbi:MAG TPA: dipeptide ABC transporter ATP-binding protein [Deltaproteobacteria bacterium]|nr:dipeptide ABC transporter ATP-binding protein [Deltaproteobacteria bacterium]